MTLVPRARVGRSCLGINVPCGGQRCLGIDVRGDILCVRVCVGGGGGGTTMPTTPVKLNTASVKIRALVLSNS